MLRKIICPKKGTVRKRYCSKTLSVLFILPETRATPKLCQAARRGGGKKEQQRRMIRSDSDTLMSLPGGGFIIRPVSCHYDPMQKLIRLLSSGGISISARCIALPPSSAPSTTKQGFPWGVLPMLIAACG